MSISNAILLALAIGQALILAWILAGRSGLPSAAATVLGIVSGGGILFSAWALSWRRERKRMFALLAVAAAAALWAADLVFLLKRVPSAEEAARKSGLPFDSRPRLEVIREFRAAGTNAVTSVTPQFFLEIDAASPGSTNLFPLAGLARRWTVGNVESGVYGMYESDEHGFNNPPGLHTPGSVDAALVGDSFTHGNHVRQEESIAGWLRAAGLRTVNLGRSGNGPLEKLATLTEYAVPLRPRAIVWVYYEQNDLDDIARSAQSPTLMRYLQEGYTQNLVQRVDEVQAALARFAEAEEARAGQSARAAPPRPAWLRALRLEHLRGRLMSRSRERARIAAGVPPLFEEILTAARNRSTACGARFYFVYLPEWGRYASGRSEDGRFRHRDTVLATIRGLNIPVIDFHEVLGRQPDPLHYFPFRVHGHYTPQGYKLLAEAIHARIAQDDSD